MLAMIPLLDMCNHFDHPEGQVDYYVYTQNNFKKLNHFLLKIQFCTDFDLESNSAKCFAYDDINKGDEVKDYLTSML